MLVKIIATIMLLALFSSGAQAQSDVNFATITAAEFKAKIAASLHNPRGEIIDALEAGAFESKRLDLVAICADADGGYFGGHFRLTAPSDFKNAIVLMLLRKPWPFDNTMQRMGGMPGEFVFLDTLFEYTPEVAAELTSEDIKTAIAAQKQFDSLSARLKFADLLEKAMSAKKLAGLASSQLEPPASGLPAVDPKAPFTPPESGQLSNVDQRTLDKLVQVQRSGEAQSAIPWIPIGIAAFFIVLVLAALRPRRGA